MRKGGKGGKKVKVKEIRRERGRGGCKTMEPRNRLHRTAFHPCET